MYSIISCTISVYYSQKKKENKPVYVEIEKNNSSLLSQNTCYTAGMPFVIEMMVLIIT